MYEHVWIEETCAFVIAPPDRVPEADDLRGKPLTFVWGFLMDPRFIAQVCGAPIPFAPAVLKGWRRETLVEEGKRGYRLAADETGIVAGVVLIDPTEAEIAALDRFERVPGVMRKETAAVRIGDLEREAHIYLKAD